MINTKSTVNEVGKLTTQIIHFSHWNKRTFSNIISSSIKDWTFTKLKLTDGRMIMVNSKNVDLIEVFNQ